MSLYINCKSHSNYTENIIIDPTKRENNHVHIPLSYNNSIITKSAWETNELIINLCHPFRISSNYRLLITCGVCDANLYFSSHVTSQ